MIVTNKMENVLLNDLDYGPELTQEDKDNILLNARCIVDYDKVVFRNHVESIKSKNL